MRDFLDKVQPYVYQYNNPAQGQGQRVGPMAQDLEQAGPVGANMVQPGPGGAKMVDTGQAALASLGAVAHLNERIKQLESDNPLAQERTRNQTALKKLGQGTEVATETAQQTAEQTGPRLEAWERFSAG